MKLQFFAAVAFALAPAAMAQTLSGMWDATIVVNGLEIPFRMELSGDRGSFFNGDEKVTSSSGHFANGTLVLTFDHYASKLEATLKDGGLEGTYNRRGRQYPFHARPAAAAPKVQ